MKNQIDLLRELVAEREDLVEENDFKLFGF